LTVNIAKKIEQIRSGNYSRQELETWRENASARGAPEVVSACDEMLAKLPQPRGRRSAADHDHEVVESRVGYTIMRSAFGDDGNMRMPYLVPVAEELAKISNVSDVSILKTEIRLYFKGRHFTAGYRPKKKVYWLGCLNETKITDGTVKCWRSIGNVSRAKYFDTYYVVVELPEITQLHQALQCVGFT
jgi:hypothetical protein